MTELVLPPRGLLSPFRRPLRLDARGLSVGGRAIAWDDIDYYTYCWNDARRTGELCVVAPGGSLRIDDGYRFWPEGVDVALRRLHERLRAAPDFRPFTLDDRALHHVRAGEIELAEVERVEIADTGHDTPGLVVTRRGSTKRWSIDDVAEVHDLLLLLERLAARGVAVQATVRFWLPPVARELAEALTIVTVLPRAEVVQRR